jgi:hypothetical protein
LYEGLDLGHEFAEDLLTLALVEFDLARLLLQQESVVDIQRLEDQTQALAAEGDALLLYFIG